MVFLVSVLFLVCRFGSGASGNPVRITLPTNANHSIQVPALKRAAMGNARIASVRSLPPDKLLITAKREGSTTLRAWDAKGNEFAWEITVTPPSLGQNEEEAVVKVALEFLELDIALSKSLGVDWPEAIQFSGGGSWQGAANMSGLNYVVTFHSAQGWIHHLIEDGWGRVLANPDLYVRLGEDAVFHSGGELPILTATQNYGGSFQHVEWKPFGLTVKVRPQSADGFHIRSDIQVEISEVNRAQSLEGLPSITKRNLQTKINARDGETVILSGLVREVSSSHKRSLPFFSSIPLIGSLFFSARRETSDENEILMAVTYSLATRSRQRDTLDKFRSRVMRDPNAASSLERTDE